MRQYQALIDHVLTNGTDSKDRTGIGTKTVFGYQMRFDLIEGFPAVTTKRLAWKAVVAELLWFLEGSTDERRLAELTYGKHRTALSDKTTIWTANADNQGKALGYVNNDFKKELGPIYGFQWRSFNADSFFHGEDQIEGVINQLKYHQDSRRIILTAWNPNMTDEMTLPPCHILIQFRVLNGKLSGQLYQRSGDIGLGIPFNIASYSLLIHLLARECNLEVGDFVHTIGDAHIYTNHIEPMLEVLRREPYPLPILKIDPKFNLMEGLRNKQFPLDSVESFSLEGYKYHSEIKMPMAV